MGTVARGSPAPGCLKPDVHDRNYIKSLMKEALEMCAAFESLVIISIYFK